MIHILILMFIFSCVPSKSFKGDNQSQESSKIPQNAESASNTTNKISDKPIKDDLKDHDDCKIHTSGYLLADKAYPDATSKIFVQDSVSEILRAGEYVDIRLAIPRSIEFTLDAIAVSQNTRLIVYSRANFKGDILLDIDGPAVVNTISKKGSDFFESKIFDYSDPDLDKDFPPNTRVWSSSRMQTWENGSMKVSCL